MQTWITRVVFVLCLASGAGLARADDIMGAGSTFVYPILAKWSAVYSDQTGHRINYQLIGSGAGIAQIKAATVDFGASDMPLSPDDLASAGLGQFPIVVGGVVPVVNIAGIAPGGIRFTGPVLADIYLGKIVRWSDPAITQINSGVSLPDAPITVVYRSDGSGTTFNFANYLSKVSPAWKQAVGDGAWVKWPKGLGAKGSEGVAAYVRQVKNSIGYVELTYAQQHAMTFAQLQNAAGHFVSPGIETFQAAAASADWSSAKDFYLVLTDAPGDNSWPITATTFVLMYKQPKDAARSQMAVAFFRWAIENGQADAQALGYVPLPRALVTPIENYWAQWFAH